jgi:hypothetical protein
MSLGEPGVTRPVGAGGRALGHEGAPPRWLATMSVENRGEGEECVGWEGIEGEEEGSPAYLVTTTRDPDLERGFCVWEF